MNANRKSPPRHMVDFLFTLALFCVFAASALLVVVIGADVYRKTVDNMERNFNSSTSLSYVSMKLRQHDAAGAVLTREVAGQDALVLEQSVGVAVYQTWIYYHDGALRELFVDREFADGLEPATGQVIVPVQDFSVETLQSGLLALTVVDGGGHSSRMLVGLRSGEVS